MVWNTMLAAMPLGFALLLFRPVQPPRRGAVWWIGFVAFIAFLPNAPYVLTDIIHLRGDVFAMHATDGHVSLLYLQYSVFFLVGVAIYAASLELLRRFLLARGWNARQALAVELALHALCAVGVLLGRFAHFNSWDLGSRPGSILDHAAARLDRPASWLLLGVTFSILIVSTLMARLVGYAVLALVRGDR
jgi:uncharacterized membrane protein